MYKTMTNSNNASNTPVQQITELLAPMRPISLEEMAGIRLMNRTDTKYVTNVQTLCRLLAMVQDEYYVQENQGHRIAPYATTYLDDTERHTMFRTHLCGHLPRVKVRVRTYLDSSQTFLEIKRKDNHGKTFKSRTEVTSLEEVTERHQGEHFLTERSGLTLGDIHPVLSNRFQRITLVNSRKTERLTIDFAIHFHNRETGQTSDMDNIVIIELKRDSRQISPITPLLRELRIKHTGFSKYCIGTMATNQALQVNRLKPRFHKIERIAHQQVS